MILLDSDVLIAHLRGVPQAQDWLLRARQETGRMGVRAVTITEIAGGMRSNEKREVTRLLASLDIFPVSSHVAWRAAEFMRQYRQSHSGIGLGHYLIAATAIAEGLQLATLNIRHFPIFEGIEPPFVMPSRCRSAGIGRANGQLSGPGTSTPNAPPSCEPSTPMRPIHSAAQVS